MEIMHSSIWPFLVLLPWLTGCAAEHPDAVPGKGYALVWADEFDGLSLDTSAWATRSANPAPFDRIPPRASCNFRNAEAFLDEQVSLRNGCLVLTARRQPYLYRGVVGGTCGVDQGCQWVGCDSFHLSVPYRSGSVFSKTGYNHGYFECRARIPAAAGLYPVFWLWHHDELVVFEFFGNPKEQYVSMHNKALFTTEKFTRKSGYADDFHTYGVAWTPFEVTWYLDGEPIKKEFKYCDPVSGEGITEDIYRPEEAYRINDTFPDSRDRWMGINLSLRVYEWSDPVDSSALPASMLVDYVRVYQKK